MALHSHSLSSSSPSLITRSEVTAERGSLVSSFPCPLLFLYHLLFSSLFLVDLPSWGCRLAVKDKDSTRWCMLNVTESPTRGVPKVILQSIVVNNLHSVRSLHCLVFVWTGAKAKYNTFCHFSLLPPDSSDHVVIWKNPTNPDVQGATYAETQSRMGKCWALRFRCQRLSSSLKTVMSCLCFKV